LPEQVDLDCINSISEIAIIFWWTMGYALFVQNMATEPVVRYDHRLNDNADSINALVYRWDFLDVIDAIQKVKGEMISDHLPFYFLAQFFVNGYT